MLNLRRRTVSLAIEDVIMFDQFDPGWSAHEGVVAGLEA